MTKEYKHLNIFDRQTIQIQLERWTKKIEIAKLLNKHKTTIYREINNNSIFKKWAKKRQYLAEDAHLKAYYKRYYSKKQSKKINMNSKMKIFIIYHLRRKDIIPSPKIIANLWNKTQSNKKNHITHTSIYTWFTTWMWDKYKKLLLFKYKGYRKTKKIKWSRIKWRIWLEKRPEWANNRTEKGHFEADLIVSKKWFKGAVLTLIDRKTRMPQIFKLKDKSSKKVMELIKSVKNKLWIKSVTFDNWLEFAFHQMLNKIWIDTYFCEPYHSREKGSIENLNKIIRIFFPKGIIFDEISHQKIRSVNKIIANTPREILYFLSPNQAHFQ